MPDAPLRIASNDLTVEVATLGAELQRVTDAQGRDLLWDGAPAFWTGRAPILFPIVGALAGGGYMLDGRRYELPKHGFARRMPFEPISVADDEVLLRLGASAETLAVYPFAFRLDLRFRV